MIKTKWVDKQHRIRLVNWNEAWLLTSPYPIKLLTEVYRGSLVFRGGAFAVLRMAVVAYGFFLIPLKISRIFSNLSIGRLFSIPVST